ncbi:MAG: DUF6525 family protein [Pseudomonadota bacterium]
MTKNLGSTGLKRHRREGDRMREFDRLPAELRRWLARAILPWGPRSVRRSFDRALAKTGDPELALSTLDRLERRQIARDAAHVWGADHPFGAEAEQ